ncbi:MAG: N-acetyltransferase [Bacteroidales bacterium]|nr:N-acetyltransferase [Bacteroidales bacterium]
MLQQLVTIRLAVPEDLQAIDEIYNQAIEIKATAHTSPLTIEERKSWFEYHEPALFPVYVAVANDAVIGWISFSPYRSGRQALKFTAEISYYIHRDFWSRGVGSQLLEFAINEAPKLNFSVLIAILLEHNKASVSLLKKFAFEKWGFLHEVAEYDHNKCGQYYYGLILRP